MSKPAVMFPDAEALVAEYMVDQFADLSIAATVKIGVPKDWTPRSGDHLQISSDGTPSGTHLVSAQVTIRMVAWSPTPSGARRLAALAQGLLLAHPGGDGIVNTRSLTGVLPARDALSHAEIAMTSTRVTVRSEPIEPTGS